MKMYWLILRLKLKWFIVDLLNVVGYQFEFNKHPGKVRVLCFHGICGDGHSYINSRFLKYTKFKKLLEALMRNYHILSLTEFIKNDLSDNKMNILLTFDDGYKNLKRFLIPILKHYELTATLFTNRCDFHWADYLDIIVAEGKIADIYIKIPELNNKDEKQIKIWAKSQKGEVISRFKIILEEIIEPFLQQYRIFHELLSHDDLVELSDMPFIYLANHTANHLNLSIESKEIVHEEVENCNSYLQNIGSDYGKVLSYPYGSNNLVCRDLLRRLGYEIQFISEPASPPDEKLIERLTVNPHISIINQLLAIDDGRYI